MIHFFKKSVSHIALPEKFTYPFHYTPHPLCVLAAEEVKEYISSRKEWQEELTLGKMFGVLIVQETGKRTRKGKEKETGESTDKDEEGGIGYLAAFSGNLAGKNLHTYFVPPVYDLLQPQGFFKIEEEQISAINIRINELENSRPYLDAKETLEERKVEERNGTGQSGVESSQSRVKSRKGSQRNPPSVLARTFRRRTSRLDSGKSISKS
jgi:tRNA pseudouridine32 synthase/23S rRNA pseudouridine746 synthase